MFNWCFQHFPTDFLSTFTLPTFTNKPFTYSITKNSKNHQNLRKFSIGSNSSLFLSSVFLPYTVFSNFSVTTLNGLFSLVFSCFFVFFPVFRHYVPIIFIFLYFSFFCSFFLRFELYSLLFFARSLTNNSLNCSQFSSFLKRNIYGSLNPSWKIYFLVVNGQSFLVIDGYLLNPLGSTSFL